MRQALDAENRYRNFFRTSRDAAFITSEDGRWIDCNEAAVDLFGYDSQEQLQEVDVEGLYADPADRKAHIETVRQQGFVEAYPVDLRRKDGGIINALISSTAIEDERGELIGFQGTIRDVTRRRKMLETLQEERNLVNGILGTSPVCITVVNRQGQIVFANERAEDVLGLEKGEITDRVYNDPEWTITDFQGHPFPDKQLPFRQVMRTGKPVHNVEHAIEGPDGQRTLLSISGAPLLNPSGEVVRVVFAIEDVTEWERTQARLMRSEQKYRYLVEQSRDGIYLLYDGKLEFINSAFEEMFGVTQEEVRAPGFDFISVVAPESRPTIEQRERKLASGESLSSQYEFTAVDGDGDRLYVEVSVSYVRYRDGLATQGVVRDVTERKEAQAELERIEWLLRRQGAPDALEFHHRPSYGDITKLNSERLILDSVGSDTLEIMVSDIMSLLETSVAVYERNGDYAYGAFVSTWCQYLDAASRRLCDTDDNAEALSCGEWLCHETCWHESAKTAIETGEPTDIACVGGIRMYAVPIRAGDEIVGAINVGYGNPPTDAETIRQLAELYDVDPDTLMARASAYNPRPPFIVTVAKQRLHAVAKLIGETVERKRTERSLRKRVKELTCLHAVNRDMQQDLSVEELCQRIIEHLVPAMQFPEITVSQIELDGRRFTSQEVAGELSHSLKADVTVRSEICGQLSVSYSEPRLFLIPEEQDLLYSIAESLGRWLKSKQTQDALRESETRYRDLTESLEQVIYRADPDTFETTFVNPAVERVYGYTVEEWLGDPKLWERTVHSEDRERVLAAFEEMGEKAKPGKLQYRITRKDGVVRWVEDRVSWKRDKEGTPVAVTGVVSDITERKELEQKVRQRAKLAAVGQLAGGIAHDFNNILASVLLYAQMGLSRPDLPSGVRDALETIQEESRRGADLVDQILDFSRRSMMDTDTVRLVELVEDALSFLHRTIPEDIQLHTDLTSRPVRIEADANRIRQALINLTLNARDAMPGGGQLRIQVERLDLGPDAERPVADMPAGRWACLSISDTGTGMTEEIKEQIFEPFFTTKEEGKGTGLGLAQVYGIVKQHDGHIEVQTAAGKGSTFNVYLPLVEYKRERDDEKPKKQRLPGRGETIMVVEDADRLRRAVRAGLESLNYEVLTAINGHEALKAISCDDIDLVLTDVVMPEMRGEELLRELRARRPNLKTVAMTGYAVETDDESLKDAGFTDVIGKPFAIEELASIIRQALEGSGT